LLTIIIVAVWFFFVVRFVFIAIMGLALTIVVQVYVDTNLAFLLFHPRIDTLNDFSIKHPSMFFHHI
jgi:hypothetical protein